MRWDAIDFCLACPGLTAVLFRRTLPQLERNHVLQIRHELPKELGVYNETKKEFRFINGSILIFKHLEHEKDVDDIQGWEIGWAGVDEAGQLTPYQINYIRSRIRIDTKTLSKWKKDAPSHVERLPRLVLSSNPGGVSHHFLKETFIDPAPAESYFYDETLASERNPKGVLSIFIPATLRDNEYLGPEYEAQFGGLPEWQQRMLRDGDWNVVPGAYFDCWGPKNVVLPFEVPDHWTRFRAWDWGFATPFAVGEFVVSDGEAVTNKAGEVVTYPAGALIMVWEYYGSEKGNKGLRMPADEVARNVLGKRGPVSYDIADDSMWRTDSGTCAAERVYNAGISLRQAASKVNMRITGWQELYSRIRDGMFYCFNTCRHFMRILPTLEADDHNPEDVRKGGEDHLADMARYACMSRPYVNHKQEEPEDPLNPKPMTFSEIMRFNDRVSRSKRDRIWN
jgi:hypothetical protein